MALVHGNFNTAQYTSPAETYMSMLNITGQHIPRETDNVIGVTQAGAADDTGLKGIVKITNLSTSTAFTVTLKSISVNSGDPIFAGTTLKEQTFNIPEDSADSYEFDLIGGYLNPGNALYLGYTTAGVPPAPVVQVQVVAADYYVAGVQEGQIILEAKREEDSTWTELVNDRKNPVTFSKELLSARDVEKQKTDSTKSIFIPSEDPINAAFFGEFKQVNNNTFEPYIHYEARIRYNGAVLIRGALYFRGYDKTSNNYKLLIAGKLGNIKTRVGDKTCAEFASLYSHDMSYSGIRNSWISALAGGRVFYPLSDNGFGFGLFTDVYRVTGTPGERAIWDFSTQQFPIPWETLRPGVSVRHLVNDALTNAGFTVSWDIDSNAVFDDLFTLLKLPKSLMESGAIAITTGQFVSALESFVSGEQRVFDLSSTSGSLIDGEISVGANGFVYSGADGEGYVEMSGKLQVNAGSRDVYPNTVLGYVENSGDPPIVLEAVGHYVIRDTTAILDINLSAPASNLPAGAIVGIWFTSGNGPCTAEFLADANTKMTFLQSGSVLTPVTMADYLSSIKQIDVIRAFFTHFNLVHDYTPGNDTITIKSYNRLIATGKNINLSERVDYTQPFEVLSLTDYVATSRVYEMGDDPSYLNKASVRAYGNNYGTAILNFDLQMLKAGSNYKSIFSPFMNTFINGLYLARLFDDYETPKSTDPVFNLFFKSGTNFTGLSWYMRNNDGNSIAQSTAPAQKMVHDSEDLFCGFRFVPGFIDQPTPANDVLSKFFMPMFSEWMGATYTPETGLSIDTDKLNAARVVKCSIFFEPLEFESISFGDRVTLETEFGTADYRYLSIKGYDPEGIRPAKVELIKIV